MRLIIAGDVAPHSPGGKVALKCVTLWHGYSRAFSKQQVVVRFDAGVPSLMRSLHQEWDERILVSRSTIGLHPVSLLRQER
jgi:hypothetical protein